MAGTDGAVSLTMTIFHACRAPGRWIGVLCLSVGMPSLAWAERPAPDRSAAHGGEHVMVSGEDLELSTPCIGRVQVSVDPAMSDGVSFDASAAGAAHVTIRTSKDQSESKVVIASKSCAPNAVLSVLVAPNIGVSIHDSRDTHFVITGTLASLEANLESGELDADTVESLDLNLRDAAHVHVGLLRRAAQIVAGGTSLFIADHADLDAFSAQLTDASRLSIADGRIDALTLMSDGAASAEIDGTANTATVTANGTGLVAIPHMTGQVTRSGAGPVRVGPQPSPPPAAPTPQTLPNPPPSAPPPRSPSPEVLPKAEPPSPAHASTAPSAEAPQLQSSSPSRSPLPSAPPPSVPQPPVSSPPKTDAVPPPIASEGHSASPQAAANVTPPPAPTQVAVKPPQVTSPPPAAPRQSQPAPIQPAPTSVAPAPVVVPPVIAQPVAAPPPSTAPAPNATPTVPSNQGNGQP